MTDGKRSAGSRDAGDAQSTPSWHQALAYAVTGRRLDLGRQSAPAMRQLADQLRADIDLEALTADVQARLERGAVWPYPLPSDLAAGLGPAQFAAALQQLTRDLGLDRSARPARVGRAQASTAADRRLLDEVPPHHGS